MPLRLFASAAILIAACAWASAAAPIQVVHISDVHIDPFYVTGAPQFGCYCETHDSCARFPESCAVTTNASLAAGPFGMPEGDCATPPALWEGAMAFLAQEHASSPASFVLFTGDFGEAGLSAACGPGESAQTQIVDNIARAMRSVRAAHGDQIPVYGVLGNVSADTVPRAQSRAPSA